MRVLDLPQGSDEWKQARCGLVTASRIADVLSKIKSGEAAARRDYRCQLIAEILSGRPQEDGFVNAEMLHGTEQEPFARAAYEAQTGEFVDTVGLVLHPSIARAAASPDGLVGNDGLIEIKAPKTSTHLQYLLDGIVPIKYEPQILWQMACTERPWCDFVSFDPRLPEDLQFFKVRFQRDDQRIAAMEKEVMIFLEEVDETLRKLAIRGLH